MKQPDALIVIPVYNHGQTLRSVVEGALAIHPDVLVVDDGSTDGGVETLRDLPVEVICHDENRGKGQAILTAVQRAKKLGKTHIVTMDADGQHYPKDIPAFLTAIKAEPRAIAVGYRHFTGPNVPGSSKFGRQFSNFWLRVQTGIKLGDVQCGFRAYPLAIFDAITTREKRFSFEVEVLVKSSWAGYPLADVDIDVYYPPREERISHFKKFKDNFELSVLNTRLTARSFLPVPHRQFTEDEEGKVSAIHPMKSLRTLLEKDETPFALALAGALGMLLGTLPLIAFHSMAIIIVLGYFKLSKITGLAVSQFCMPPFVPALCIEAGFYMRNGHFLTDMSLETLGYQALDRIWEWILGSLVLAPLFAIIFGIIIYVLAWIVKVRLKKNSISA
ncbi:MAG: glycosyltransferase family 2 protein [Pseudodesulfovibrio sp.]